MCWPFPASVGALNNEEMANQNSPERSFAPMTLLRRRSRPRDFGAARLPPAVNLRQALVLNKQFHRRATIEVIDEFAVWPREGEGEPVDDLPLSQLAQAAVRYLLIAADQAHEARE